VSLLAAALALCGIVTPQAAAAPAVSLRAKLTPNRLDAATAVSIGFRLAPGPQGEQPPLSEFDLRLPPGMTFAGSTLGLAVCSPARLLALGPGGCPHESLIGFGSAQVRVPFGTQAVREAAPLSIFMARPVGQRTTALFYFDGRRPVLAPLLLRSEVATLPGSGNSALITPIPPILTTPDGPEAAVRALRATIGPSRLRYFKRVDGRVVAYHPRGIAIPSSCPPGGFVFAAELRFRDGSHAHAETAVPCPGSRGGQGGGGE
jgi:hypothetical protein